MRGSGGRTVLRIAWAIMVTCTLLKKTVPKTFDVFERFSTIGLPKSQQR